MTTYLITSNPHSRQGKQALDTVRDALESARQAGRSSDTLRVFFYGDGAYTANRLMWQTSDVPNIAHAWASLASDHDLALPVCVSTALARGVTDRDNALRHGLGADNVLAPFYLVGLSEFALMLERDHDLVQL